jgi:hypothetical protein
MHNGHGELQTGTECFDRRLHVLIQDPHFDQAMRLHGFSIAA